MLKRWKNPPATEQGDADKEGSDIVDVAYEVLGPPAERKPTAAEKVDFNEVSRLRHAGYSMGQIATLYGVSRATLYRVWAGKD